MNTLVTWLNTSPYTCITLQYKEHINIYEQYLIIKQCTLCQEMHLYRFLFLIFHVMFYLPSPLTNCSHLLSAAQNSDQRPINWKSRIVCFWKWRHFMACALSRMNVGWTFSKRKATPSMLLSSMLLIPHSLSLGCWFDFHLTK